MTFPIWPSFSKLLFFLTTPAPAPSHRPVYLALRAIRTQSPSTFLEKIKFRLKIKEMPLALPSYLSDILNYLKIHYRCYNIIQIMMVTAVQ